MKYECGWCSSLERDVCHTVIVYSDSNTAFLPDTWRQIAQIYAQFLYNHRNSPTKYNIADCYATENTNRNKCIFQTNVCKVKGHTHTLFD